MKDSPSPTREADCEDSPKSPEVTSEADPLIYDDIEMAAAFQLVEWQGMAPPSVVVEASPGYSVKSDQSDTDALSTVANPGWSDVSEESGISSTNSPRSSNTVFPDENLEPEPSPVQRPPNYREFMGIKNQGTTCYLNCIIQSLFFTPEFRDMVFNWDPLDLPVYSLPKALQNIFASLRLSDEPVETVELTNCPEWALCGQVLMQNDVQEFTSKLFESLEDSLSKTNCYSSFRDFYTGKLIDYTQCQNCKTIKQHEDIIQDITLPVHEISSVEQALNAFVKPEELTKSNQYYCDVCKAKCDATKGLILTKNPFILSIVLKRFGFNWNKLTNRVTFPAYLCMDQFTGTINLHEDGMYKQKEEENTVKSKLHEDGIHKQNEEENTVNSKLHEDGMYTQKEDENTVKSKLLEDGMYTQKEEENAVNSKGNDHQAPVKDKKNQLYELFVVHVHTGSGKCGHYFSYIKSLETNRWLKFNDEIVSEVNQDEVIPGVYESHYNKTDKNAYTLLYRKIDMTKENIKIENYQMPQRILDNLSAMKDEAKLHLHFKNVLVDMVGISKCPWQHVIWQKGLTVKEVLSKAITHFKLDTPISMFRVVKIDQRNLMIIHSYEEEEEILNEPHKNIHLWLQMRDSDVPFPVYPRSNINLNVIHFDPSCVHIKNVKMLNINFNSTLKELKEVVAEEFGAPKEDLQIVVQTIGAFPTVLSEDEAPISSALSRYPVRLYAINQSVKDEDESMKICEAVNELAHVAQIYMNLPLYRNTDTSDSSEIKEATGITSSSQNYTFKYTEILTDKQISENTDRRVLCSIDTRGSSSWLTGVVQTLLKVNSSSEVLYLFTEPVVGPSSAKLLERYTPMKDVFGDYNSDIMYPTFDITGKVMSENEMTNIKVSLLDMGDRNNHLSKKVEVTVERGVSISQLKKEVIHQFAEKHKVNLVHDRSRLRELEGVSVSKVYHDMTKLSKIIESSNEAKMCIQAVAEKQKLFSMKRDCYFIFVQEYLPQKDELGEVHEMFLSINDVDEMTETILNITQASEDDLRFLLGPTKYPSRVPAHKKTTTCWHTLQDLKRTVDEIYSDGQVIFYRKPLLYVQKSFLYNLVVQPPARPKVEFCDITPDRQYELGAQGAICKRDQPWASPTGTTASEQPVDLTKCQCDKVEPSAKTCKRKHPTDWSEEYALCYALMGSDTTPPITPIPSPTNSISDEELVNFID